MSPITPGVRSWNQGCGLQGQKQSDQLSKAVAKFEKKASNEVEDNLIEAVNAFRLKAEKNAIHEMTEQVDMLQMMKAKIE